MFGRLDAFADEDYARENSQITYDLIQPDGSYEKIDKRGKTLICSQDYFCEEATRKAQVVLEPADTRVFRPAEPLEERRDS